MEIIRHLSFSTEFFFSPSNSPAKKQPQNAFDTQATFTKEMDEVLKTMSEFEFSARSNNSQKEQIVEDSFKGFVKRPLSPKSSKIKELKEEFLRDYLSSELIDNEMKTMLTRIFGAEARSMDWEQLKGLLRKFRSRRRVIDYKLENRDITKDQSYEFMLARPLASPPIVPKGKKLCLVFNDNLNPALRRPLYIKENRLKRTGSTDISLESIFMKSWYSEKMDEIIEEKRDSFKSEAHNNYSRKSSILRENDTTKPNKPIIPQNTPSVREDQKTLVKRQMTTKTIQQSLSDLDPSLLAQTSKNKPQGRLTTTSHHSRHRMSLIDNSLLDFKRNSTSDERRFAISRVASNRSEGENEDQESIEKLKVFFGLARRKSDETLRQGGTSKKSLRKSDTLAESEIGFILNFRSECKEALKKESGRELQGETDKEKEKASLGLGITAKKHSEKFFVNIFLGKLLKFKMQEMHSRGENKPGDKELLELKFLDDLTSSKKSGIQTRIEEMMKGSNDSSVRSLHKAISEEGKSGESPKGQPSEKETRKGSMDYSEKMKTSKKEDSMPFSDLYPFKTKLPIPAGKFNKEEDSQSQKRIGSAQKRVIFKSFERDYSRKSSIAFKKNQSSHSKERNHEIDLGSPGLNSIPSLHGSILVKGKFGDSDQFQKTGTDGGNPKKTLSFSDHRKTKSSSNIFKVQMKTQEARESGFKRESHFKTESLNFQSFDEALPLKSVKGSSKQLPGLSSKSKERNKGEKLDSYFFYQKLLAREEKLEKSRKLLLSQGGKENGFLAVMGAFRSNGGAGVRYMMNTDSQRERIMGVNVNAKNPKSIKQIYKEKRRTEARPIFNSFSTGSTN